MARGAGFFGDPRCILINKLERVLVTGGAGFIGYHVARQLLSEGAQVHVVDNLNSYYSVDLKRARLKELAPYPNFQFQELDLADQAGVARLFESYEPEYVVHLAAQAGVRTSLTHPHLYIDANMTGFLTILEGCRAHPVKHLVYASSSSVYGANPAPILSVRDNVDHPVSLYGATKKANELMAHSYSHLFGLPCTGLRFFSVYGPWGRPDMALWKFTEAILKGEPIDVYNFGKMKRDFTCVDDIVAGVIATMRFVPDQSPPYRLYNIGNHRPVELIEFIEMLEASLGKTAERNMMPMQPGDVLETCADVDDLMRDVGFKPQTPIEVGIPRFVDWYRSYHHL